jgi:hypothetical protein
MYEAEPKCTSTLLEKQALHSYSSYGATDVTFKMMPPPVEWPKQKHGSPGFSAETFLRYIFYSETKAIE